MKTYFSLSIAAFALLAGCSQLPNTSTSNSTDTRLVESFPEGLFVDVSRESLKSWQWQASTSNSESQAIIRTVQLDYFMKEAVNIDAAKAFCTI